MKSAVPQISVQNLQRAIRVDVVDLEKFARRAVKLCLALPHKKQSELAQLPEVSILIVSDRKIAALHQQFMNESGPTDVITFQHGEIFVSGETARRHARLFKNSLTCELKLYIVHGLLHLLGFDDRNTRQAERMRAVQSKILARASL